MFFLKARRGRQEIESQWCLCRSLKQLLKSWGLEEGMGREKRKLGIFFVCEDFVLGAKGLSLSGIGF